MYNMNKSVEKPNDFNSLFQTLYDIFHQDTRTHYQSEYNLHLQTLKGCLDKKNISGDFVCMSLNTCLVILTKIYEDFKHDILDLLIELCSFDLELIMTCNFEELHDQLGYLNTKLNEKQFNDLVYFILKSFVPIFKPMSY